MSASATVAAFLASAALALLMARMSCAIEWRKWRAFGKDTEIDLASLYIFVTAGQLRLITAIMLAATIGVAWALDASWQVLVLAVGACTTLPRFVVGWLQHRRCERILGQLPDALTQWAGLLLAGQGLTHALGQIASRQALPLRDDLAMLVRQHRVGMPIEQAVEEWRSRTGIADLSMVSTLLRTTRELGGNLAESMARLAEVMRSRMAMEARIRALTSQGKLQGLIVGLLPLLLLVVLGAMEPEAMSKLYQTPAGWAALGVIVALEATGFVLIRRIVSIEV